MKHLDGHVESCGNVDVVAFHEKELRDEVRLRHGENNFLLLLVRVPYANALFVQRCKLADVAVVDHGMDLGVVLGELLFELKAVGDMTHVELSDFTTYETHVSKQGAWIIRLGVDQTGLNTGAYPVVVILVASSR